ncbi:MAG: hypothetical protein OZ921_00660 [Sorangiineae bacterium]|nr:hypothetical protein [Polyangiaceae bacterium]MEB2320994.1 hypothetical protein [Sorangiineae bacterium]
MPKRKIPFNPIDWCAPSLTAHDPSSAPTPCITRAGARGQSDPAVGLRDDHPDQAELLHPVEHVLREPPLAIDARRVALGVEELAGVVNDAVRVVALVRAQLRVWED